MGEPLENALRTLISNKIITLPEARPYEPQVNPSWWNDTHHCEYHKNKGNKKNECMRLKHVIQDLIDDGVIKVDNPQNNKDHMTFKTPFFNHEKGEPSNSNQNNKRSNAEVNFSHTYDIDINSQSGYKNKINVIMVKDKQEKETSNVVTRRQASKITLQGTTPKTTCLNQSSSFLRQYNLMNQLQKTPT